MICILVVAPILTKKWDLVSIIRVCLLGGFAVLACTLAYTLMVPDTNAWVFIIANSASVLIITGIGYDAALTAAGLPQADSTIAGLKLMVIGFPMVAALCSFCCFTFIWNINADVRAKMAQWKAAKAAK